MEQAPHILIMAAGRGKRMKSRYPKVMHPVLFRSMLHHVLDLATSVPHSTVSVVVGFGADMVKEHCKDYGNVNFVLQDKQLGTADAVKRARDYLEPKGGSVLVLSGDVILLTPATLTELMEVHREHKAVATLLTGKLSQPKGYGRILKNSAGQVIGIREEVDCSEEERKINEVNSGIYCFQVKELFEALDRVKNRNKQEEYYLTDVIEFFAKDARPMATVCLNDPMEMTGINDRYALARVEAHLQKQVNRALMFEGVTIHSPESVFIDPRSRIDSDVTIESGAHIINSVIDSGVVIEANCRIVNSAIAKGSHIKQGSYIVQSLIGAHCSVGPYAHFRPGTRLENSVKVGNFVEIKKSLLRDGAKASHLSYIGDAEIGRNTNLGCGFITCNYDGVEKHRTVIEDDVFVGSDSQTVAPVKIAKGSYIASGSTITEDVPPDSLALSRGKQVTKPGYAKKYRSRSSRKGQVPEAAERTRRETP